MRCGAYLLLLLVGLACLAQQSSGLRAESAALKRNKKKKKAEQQRQRKQQEGKEGQEGLRREREKEKER